MVLLAVLLLLNIFPIEVTKELLFQSRVASLNSQTAVISSALIELDTLTHQTVSRVIDLLEVRGLSRLVITNEMGEILYDSDRPNQIRSGQYLLDQELIVALEGYHVVRSEYQENQVYSVAASPIVYRENTIGAIYALEIDEEQGLLLQSLQDNLRTISWVAAALATSMCVPSSLRYSLNGFEPY